MGTDLVKHTKIETSEMITGEAANNILRKGITLLRSLRFSYVYFEGTIYHIRHWNGGVEQMYIPDIYKLTRALGRKATPSAVELDKAPMIHDDLSIGGCRIVSDGEVLAVMHRKEERIDGKRVLVPVILQAYCFS